MASKVDTYKERKERAQAHQRRSAEQERIRTLLESGASPMDIELSR